MERLLFFADGTPDGGGSGFRNMLVSARGNSGQLKANIVGVVCAYPEGGVAKIAREFGIPFALAPGTFKVDAAPFLERFQPDFIAFSGCNRRVLNTPPTRTINIHPAPLPAFGGKRMHGLHVHEEVLAAYSRGEITHTEVTMHYVTEKYDDGPTFFRHKVEILATDNPEKLQDRVKAQEHLWQPALTSMVLSGEIAWDGVHDVVGAILD